MQHQGPPQPTFMDPPDALTQPGPAAMQKMAP